MSQKFSGKVALGTGGSNGIGLAAALAFANEGAGVVFTGRDQSNLDKAAAQPGQNVVAVRSDVGSIADGLKLTTVLTLQGVKLDAVFINAGIAKLVPFEAVGEEMRDVTLNTNVKGLYFLIKALIRLLNPRAVIVLNGSINARIGMPHTNTSVYAANKAALISLAKTLSSELLSRDVRVSVVSPGPVTAHLLDRLGLPAEQLSQVAAGIQARIPLKHFGTPEEIASAVMYLASTESAFVVDTEMVADWRMSQLRLSPITFQGLRGPAGNENGNIQNCEGKNLNQVSVGKWENRKIMHEAFYHSCCRWPTSGELHDHSVAPRPVALSLRSASDHAWNSYRDRVTGGVRRGHLHKLTLNHRKDYPCPLQPKPAIS